MIIGFAMLKTLCGHENEAYLDLGKISGVKEAYRILGEYQIFVILQPEDAAALHSLIDMVQSIPYATDICNVLVTDKVASKQMAPVGRSSLDFKIPVRARSSIAATLKLAPIT